MNKIICIILPALALCSCHSKGTLTDMVETVLDENQGVTIEITPHKELK